MARALARRAFTLLEVLMAVALIAFGILTMVGVYVSGLRLVAQGRAVTAATDAARSVLEAVEELGFDRIPDGPVTFDGRRGDPAVPPFPPAPYPTAVIGDREFAVVVSTAKQDTFLKSVVVTVYWGRSSSLSLQTLVGP